MLHLDRCENKKYFDENKQNMLDIVFGNQKDWIIAVITVYFQKS